MNDARIEARDYTFVQAFYPTRPIHDMTRRFLVGSPFRRDAEARAWQFAREHWGDPSRVILYPRNFVAKARALAAQGLADWL